MKVVLLLIALAAVSAQNTEMITTEAEQITDHPYFQTHSVQVKNQVAAVTSADHTVTTTQVFAPKAPCPPKAEEQVVQGVVQQEPVTIVHEAVPAKVGPFIKIVKETPVAPAPATVKYVVRPVPVPVPVPVVAPRTHCTVDVKACFASRPNFNTPSWKIGVDYWQTGFSTMCGPEIAAKAAVKEKKTKAELATKELCSKNEGNQKYAERKMKLAVKKEKYSKTVAEGQEKFLEKKIKSAQEAATKTIGQSKERSKKSAERADKREDELYKKECASKETSFKAVREARTKVKVVYVNAVPQSVSAAEPTPVPAPGKVIETVTTVKPVPAPAPVVDKTVVYVPAPVTRTVIETKVHHERLFKSKELTTKENSKSSELLAKENFRSQEAVDKEAVHKGHHVAVVVHKSNEGACKEKESKEFATKSEIKTKLAVEKVRKEIAAKEAKSKVVLVVVKKPCSPESSLEVYVKHCKMTEEKYEKAKTIGERDIKEAKAKAHMRAEEVQCSLARDICRKIYHYSTMHDDKIRDMVADHTKQLEIAWNKAQSFSADKASKTQYKICESAANDMKYFAHNFLKSGGTGQDGAVIDFKMQ